MAQCRYVFSVVLFWTTAAMLFFCWPLAAWAKYTPDVGGDDASLTHQGWIAEHVWIGVIGAFLVILGVRALLRRPWDDESASLGLLSAWPMLTWATGSDYTGYALTRAGWIAGAAWLGALVVYVVVIFVDDAVGPLSGFRRRRARRS